MDGTLFDSMPRHAWSWEQTMAQAGLHFTAADCYRGEGRRGVEVIETAIREQLHREPEAGEAQRIYKIKAELFAKGGETQPIPDAPELLKMLKEQGDDIWIVTGSGQQSLFQTLDRHFPGIFIRERMITATDVNKGKPDPEPYLKAWERCGKDKKECIVVENAPMGIQSGKAAGLYTIGVNTGPLPDSDLTDAGADIVVPNMKSLIQIIQTQQI